MTRCDPQERGDLELFFYGELDGQARTELAAHLTTCRECRSALDELTLIRHVLAARPDVSVPPAGDWSGFMSRLDVALERGRPGKAIPRPPMVVRPSIPSHRSYVAYVAMAAMLTLVTASAGYLATHRSTLSGTRAAAATSPPAAPGVAPSSSVPAGAVTMAGDGGRRSEDAAFTAISGQHFERSKLVVLGLATKDPRRVSASDWAYERQLASALLSDTQLYKRAAEDRGLLSLARVMSDLEIVLLQTSLSDDHDTASLERIQRLIRRRDLVTKMDVMETSTQGF